MAPVTVADGIDPSDRSDEASASSAHQPVDEKKGPVIVDVTEEDEKRVGSIASAIHDVAEHDSEAKMAAVVDPRMKDYPIPMVAMTVGLDDNPAEPMLTFRFWVLSTFFVIFGCGISTLFWFKPFGTVFSDQAVQLLSWGLGYLMAKILPEKTFSTFGFKWTMNPGPFALKEHVLIYVAYCSANYVAYGLGALSTLELYYEKKVNAGWGIMYLLTSQLIGYGVAGVLREHLVTPTKMYYPLALPVVAVFNTMHQHVAATKASLKFFGMVIAVTFCYEWFPQYMIPLIVSMPLICWMGHGNPIAYVLGSGNRGYGLLTLSLDWNVASGSSAMFKPLWAYMTQSAGVIFACWFLYPILYYTNTFGGKNYGAMDNRIWTSEGTRYNTSLILTKDFQLNGTALAEYGQPQWSTAYIFRFFFGFTASTASIAYAALYYGRDAWIIAKKSWKNQAVEYNDPLLDAMKKYPKVPRWWYYGLLVVSIGLSMATFYCGHFELPWWGFLLFFAIAIVLLYPNGILTAIAGIGIGDTFVTDLVAGLVFHGSPMAVLTCFSFANPILDQALSLLSDFKLGFYTKVPEREMFIGQLWGTFLGPFVNFGIMRFVFNTIDHDTLKGIKPSVTWNALATRAWYSASVLWGILGPKAIFSKETGYDFVYFGVLIGPVLVLAVFLLQKWRPHWDTETYCNVAIFLSGIPEFPTSPMTNFFTGAIVSLVFMGYLLRYHPVWWSKFHYLLAVGLDTGAALQGLVMMFALNLPDISFPSWFGNNMDYPDRCFPPNSKLPTAMQG